MQIRVVNVSIETSKGKNPWSKAAVIHMVDGQTRTQNVMSFTNPKVFQTVKEMQPGEDYDVTVVKNDKGYNEWAAIARATGEAPAAANTRQGTTATVRSTYETPEERKLKQLYIIRQSSISNAIDYFKGVADSGNEVPTVESVLAVAQQFVDFVYQSPNDLFDEPNDLQD